MSPPVSRGARPLSTPTRIPNAASLGSAAVDVIADPLVANDGPGSSYGIRNKTAWPGHTRPCRNLMPSGRNRYRDRRKLNNACWSCSDSMLNLLITPLASEPWLACSLMACWMSSVRPSCRKKMRWPTPHSGAERNSFPLAAPWATLSASPTPMLCRAMSENRFAVLPRKAATDWSSEVVRLGVWHRLQPIAENTCFPRAVEAAETDFPSLVVNEVVTGVGWSRKRWKLAKFSIA